MAINLINVINCEVCAHRKQNNSFEQQKWLKSLPATAKQNFVYLCVCMCVSMFICVCACALVCCSFQRVRGQRAVMLDNLNRSCSCESLRAHSLLSLSPLCPTVCPSVSAIKIYCFVNWPMIVNNKNVLAALFSVFHSKWPGQFPLYWQWINGQMKRCMPHLNVRKWTTNWQCAMVGGGWAHIESIK